MSTRRRALRRLAVMTAVTAAAAGMVTSAAVAASPGGHGADRVTVRSGAKTARPVAVRGHGTIRYAKDEHLCSQHVRPGYSTCFAMRRVDVPKGTPGARAYVRPSYGLGVAGGYTPGDLATAYGVNPNGGTGQTVAIVDGYNDPYALQELNIFDGHYNLPLETSASFKKVNQNGSTSHLPSANASWAGEIALDLQAVRGLCHKCKILLVEAKNPSNVNLAAAVNTAARLHATEISNSYGAPEVGDNAKIQSAYKHPGIVITASTGDHGWYDWDFANDVDGSNPANSGASDDMPNTPAAFPSVVAVGGTALLLNSDGTRATEQVWNENGADDGNGLDDFGWEGDNGASGGGCSFRFAAPSWQAGVSNYKRTGCGSKRSTGDVAALADPQTGYDIYDTYQNAWITIGGTSLASPLVAAMWALAGGAGGQAYPARSLYNNFKYHASSAYDVRLGGNAFCAGDSKTNCSAILSGETHDSNGQPGNGNPNNLANGSSQHNAEHPSQGDGWAGLLDCGYAYNGGGGLFTNDAQCNAYPGYDGPSGVGAAKGVALFRHTNPNVSIATAHTIKARTATTLQAHVSEPLSQARVTSYAWTFGDGAKGSGSAPRHTYAKAGSYLVTLTVTDNLHQASTARVHVSVHKA